MAHGLNSVLKRGSNSLGCKNEGKAGIGSRRIFAPQFKLQVLDSYRNDADCKGNQRATARKYGIHRRQIQKWLQVEGNLRNSVIKGKSSELAASPELALRSVALRQRDDERAGAFVQRAPEDKRVPDIPTLSPGACSETRCSSDCSPPPPSAPLDFTTHSRIPAPQDPGAPIDLSLKKPSPPLYPEASGEPSTPVPHTRSPTPLPPPSSSEIWDLSTKRKFSDHHEPDHPKPIKLFKPYLDDTDETSTSSSTDCTKTYIKPEIKQEPCQPSCCSIPVDPDVLYYNNNHITEYIQPDYTSYPTYHELEPRNINYYYPIKNYLYSQNAIKSENYCSNHYEDMNGVHGIGSASQSLKQRQSYSLDFKLRAIECYYSDVTCRGNQRAVAMKLNIHRRQVQKWLKQEEELRQRNVSSKHLHVIR